MSRDIDRSAVQLGDRLRCHGVGSGIIEGELTVREGTVVVVGGVTFDTRAAKRIELLHRPRHVSNGDDIQLEAPTVEVGRFGDEVRLAVTDGGEEVVDLRLTGQQARELAGNLTRAANS